MTWQPIESAPKDGSRVLVYRRNYEESCAVVWWTTDGWCVPVYGFTFQNPTHWMPLPEPPA